jgi:hypothetical protein
MISESWPWKQQLLKDADLIDRWASKVSTRRSFLIEKKVFLSAYAMRKLFDAEKLSSNLNGRNVSAQRYDPIPEKKMTWWTTQSFHQVFNLQVPVRCSVPVRDVLNLIIHSRVFAEAIYSETDLRVQGFFLNSDNNDDKLWRIPIAAFTALMRIVGKDNPTTAYFEFDRQAGKHRTWRGNGSPIPNIADTLERARDGNTRARSDKAEPSRNSPESSDS